MREAIYAGITGAIFAGVLMFIAMNSGGSAPSEGIAAPLESVRELHCAEDADIVVTLGQNGLPMAFCEQVIER